MSKKNWWSIAFFAIIGIFIGYSMWVVSSGMQRTELEVYSVCLTASFPAAMGLAFLLGRREASLYLDGVRSGIKKVRAISVETRNPPATKPTSIQPEVFNQNDFIAPIRHAETKGGDLEI